MSECAFPDLKEASVEGFDAFQRKIKELVGADPNARIFIMFTGNPESDKGSWCPDCRELEALLLKVLPIVKPAGTLLRVLVGHRPEWKSPDSPFRTDQKLRLTSIPTLLEWGTVRRLSDHDVESQANVEMFFRVDH